MSQHLKQVKRIRVMNYSHTQRVPKGVLTAFGAVGGVAALRTPGLVKPLLGATMAGLLYTFRSMTVSIDEHHINIVFGDWLSLKQIKLAYIQKVETKKMCPLSGWGVHFIGDGWLYNVFGLDAVRVSMKSGKTIYIGTDEPLLLAAAIREAANLPEIDPTEVEEELEVDSLTS